VNELAHTYGDSARFLREYQECFATRADGSSWPNWETTWLRGTQYFRGLVRPGSNKSIAGIASMVDIKQEKLERFVRESVWEYENVEEQLRMTAPEAAQPPLRSFSMGWESPNKDTTALVLAVSGAVQLAKWTTAR
jgi:hypothetical protein